MAFVGVVCGVLFIPVQLVCFVCGTLQGCLVCVGLFWRSGTLLLFSEGFYILFMFRSIEWLYENINRGQVFLLYPLGISWEIIFYSPEPNYLCAVVSKTLVFLTFQLYCQNSSTLSAIIYYLSDTCIIQGFNL